MLLEESVNFVSSFSTSFADGLAEDLEFRRVRKNSGHAVDVFSFVSDDDFAALVRT